MKKDKDLLNGNVGINRCYFKAKYGCAWDRYGTCIDIMSSTCEKQSRPEKSLRQEPYAPLKDSESEPSHSHSTHLGI